MRRGRQRRRPRSRRRRARPQTESPKPPETQAAKPAETSPAEPKSSEAPKTPVARQPDPAKTARATGRCVEISADRRRRQRLQGSSGHWQLALRPSEPSCRSGPAGLLHTHQVADGCEDPAPVVSGRPPAPGGGAHHSRQRGSGYRTFSRQTVNDSGEWRVELRASDGTLLREERFTVR